MTHSGIPINPNSPLTPEQQEEMNKRIMDALVKNQAAGQQMDPSTMAQVLGMMPGHPPAPMPGPPQPSQQPHPGNHPAHTHSHAPVTPPAPEKSQDEVKRMDTDETLRVENLLLRDQMEKMHQQLEDMRREIARRDLDKHKQGLQDYLQDKHGVDGKTHRIVIDAQSHTLTIKQLED